MLALGRALMGAPRLLLLDEPSMGLAPLFVDEIFAIIADLKREGTTILLVEQNASAALEVADYAYVLENGRTVLEGPGGRRGRRPRSRRRLSGRMIGAETVLGVILTSPTRRRRAAPGQ